MSIQQSAAKHETFYQEIIRLLNKHAGHLDAIEMLAIAANMVGKMIAMQDQRKYQSVEIMNLVARNIEEGNRQAIAELLFSSGGKA